MPEHGSNITLDAVGSPLGLYTPLNFVNILQNGAGRMPSPSRVLGALPIKGYVTVRGLGFPNRPGFLLVL